MKGSNMKNISPIESWPDKFRELGLLNLPSLSEVVIYCVSLSTPWNMAQRLRECTWT